MPWLNEFNKYSVFKRAKSSLKRISLSQKQRFCSRNQLHHRENRSSPSANHIECGIYSHLPHRSHKNVFALSKRRWTTKPNQSRCISIVNASKHGMAYTTVPRIHVQRKRRKINDWYVIVINFSWNVHRSSADTHNLCRCFLRSLHKKAYFVLFGIFKMSWFVFFSSCYSLFHWTMLPTVIFSFII